MIQRQLTDAIRAGELNVVKKLLETSLDMIDSLIGGDEKTVLHLAADQNQTELAKHFLSLYETLMSQQPAKYTAAGKVKWINRKDSDGFMCLHYAVFRANNKLAFLLEEAGADIYAINKQGLSLLHIAAQGDSPALMVLQRLKQYWYLSQGFKISSIDSKGSTALHWACYSGAENAAYALLSWGAEADMQDSTFGMTPLHVAVLSGNSRIIRKLLMKGCDRNQRNFEGKLALDLALEKDYKTIVDMIVDKQGIAELFNIKTPYRKVQKLTFPFYFLLVLFLTNYLLNVSFVVATHFNDFSELAVAFLLSGLLVAILFTANCRVSPGYLQGSPDSYFDLIKRHHPSKICFDCKILKPQRSRHCEICGYCICVYDHHCPWVGNCIGANNYCVFFAFLMAMWLFVLFTIAFEITSTLAHYADLTMIQWNVYTFIEIVRTICVFYGLACSLLFLLPLTFLLAVQCKNLLTNETTFERYNYNATIVQQRLSKTSQRSMSSFRKSRGSETGSMMNETSSIRESARYIEQDSNYASNCASMCCLNKHNILYKVGGIK